MTKKIKNTRRFFEELNKKVEEMSDEELLDRIQALRLGRIRAGKFRPKLSRIEKAREKFIKDIEALDIPEEKKRRIIKTVRESRGEYQEDKP